MMGITNDLEICSKRAIEWCNRRGLLIKALPNIAIGNEHVVMFIAETNSNFCFIEPMVTNPSSSADDRRISISLVFKEIEKKARDLGYSKIYALTKIKQVKQYAKNHGFKASDFSLLEKGVL